MNSEGMVMSRAEELLTVAAYVSYIVSLLGYVGYLLAQVAGQRLAVRVAREVGQPILAGVGSGNRGNERGEYG